MHKKKLAIITSHPIQYNAPLFRLIHERQQIEVKVFYTWGQAQEKIYDPGFGKERSWDIPLLEGYEYEFVENTSKKPGSNHFKGIINPSLIYRIQLFKPDAILVFGWSFSSHLKVLRYFKGKIPIYFRGDSTLLNEHDGFSFKKLLRRITLIWVYSHIDYAFYVGLANKEYFLAHWLKSKQLIFAPHAIDNNRFSNTDLEAENEALKWRESLMINPNEIVFLFAGKIEIEKNLFELIKAFILLKGKAHLIVVGNGNLEFELKNIAKKNKNIHFLAFQNQSKMPIIYRLADVFILPSKSETWGLAINEAMACKRAVIVSNKCGCAWDLVEDGINGFIFQYNDNEQLKNVLENCIQNKPQLKQMGIASFEKIQKWNYTEIASAIELVIKSS